MSITVQQEWKYTDPLLFTNMELTPLNISHKNTNENIIEINENEILCPESSEFIEISINSKKLIDSYFNNDFNKNLKKYTLAGNDYNSVKCNSIFVKVLSSKNMHQLKLRVNTSEKINADIQLHIYFENGAKLELIDESDLKGNSTIRIFSLMENSALFNFYRFNNYNPEKVNSIFHFIRVNEKSTFKDYNFNNGSKQFRGETIVNLDGEKSEFISIGTVISNSTHSDNVVEINHNSHSATSDCFFKAISKGTSNVIFDGKIFVDDNCSNTVSNQMSKGLLMDEMARINLMPKLEINNDDVICSHGAASGKPDDETLFYLTSRGMSKQEAKKLYVQGFLSEFTESIENKEMKEKAKQYILLNS